MSALRNVPGRTDGPSDTDAVPDTFSKWAVIWKRQASAQRPEELESKAQKTPADYPMQNKIFPESSKSMLEMGIPIRCIPWDTAKAQATYNESTVVLDMQSKL